jgi:hypothetical protein
VVRLFRDPALRARLGERAHAVAREQYGWGAVGERLDAVCRTVLEGRAGGSGPRRAAANAG